MFGVVPVLKFLQSFDRTFHDNLSYDQKAAINCFVFGLTLV